jgi:hypothetical protein
MIRLEQIMVWLGVASLGFMIFFLAMGDRLDPEIAARFTGGGPGPVIVAIFFLTGVAGVFLLGANLARGRRDRLVPRLASLTVFLLALAVFFTHYR